MSNDIMQLPKRKHLEVIFYRTKVQIASEDSRNYLSFLWWIIDPLIELCIFYVVFGLILQRGGSEFIAELLTGIFVIRLYISVTNIAPSLLIHNEHILLSVAIPKYIIPASHSVTCVFKFTFLLIILNVFLMFLGVQPHLSNLMAIPITVSYILFTLGVAMLLAGITPFAPDIAMVYPKINMLLYWGSGVFFKPEDYISAKYVPWFNANPIAGFITAYRDCLLHKTVDFKLLGYLFVVSLFSLAAGYIFLSYFDKKYPRIIMQR